MKYRCLYDEELKELEEDFKHFLITNAIYQQSNRVVFRFFDTLAD